jgi:hypothetical protein
VTHGGAGVDCHDDAALEDESEGGGAWVGGDVPVLKSMILLSSPPECLM